MPGILAVGFEQVSFKQAGFGFEPPPLFEFRVRTSRVHTQGDVGQTDLPT